MVLGEAGIPLRHIPGRSNGYSFIGHNGDDTIAGDDKASRRASYSSPSMASSSAGGLAKKRRNPWGKNATRYTDTPEDEVDLLTGRADDAEDEDARNPESTILLEAVNVPVSAKTAMALSCGVAEWSLV
jgi:hypothetical protein